MSLDTATQFGQRATQRLQEAVVIWLTTVDTRGTPQPVPVWFLWDGSTFLVFSQPDTAKLRSIERNPRVALHLDGNGRGGDIVVATGNAEILGDGPTADQVPEYIEKYREHIKRIGYDLPAFGQSYSVAIRITPTRFRGF